MIATCYIADIIQVRGKLSALLIEFVRQIQVISVAVELVVLDRGAEAAARAQRRAVRPPASLTGRW